MCHFELNFLFFLFVVDDGSFCPYHHLRFYVSCARKSLGEKNREDLLFFSLRFYQISYIA